MSSYQAFSRQSYGTAEAPGIAPAAAGSDSASSNEEDEEGMYPDWKRLGAVAIGVTICFALVALASQATYTAINKTGAL